MTSTPDHPDLQLPWCQKLFKEPGVQILQEPKLHEDAVQNPLFRKVLARGDAIRARLQLRRPAKSPDAPPNTSEECVLLSLGHDIDGMAGRAHGGFSSLVLDHMLGTTAHSVSPRSAPPATATMTVDYKAPIVTPTVIIVRAWAVEITGRKVWLRGSVENGEDGRVYALAKALFILSRMPSL